MKRERFRPGSKVQVREGVFLAQGAVRSRVGIIDSGPSLSATGKKLFTVIVRGTGARVCYLQRELAAAQKEA